MLELGFKVLIAYLLGSIVGALVIGQLRGVDIRTMGSGNAGGTNALRTQGLGFAAATVVIDVGKGWLAAGWLPGLAVPGVAADPAIARDWLAVSCAAAAVAGHVWPLWHDFRGGKGGATLAGALLALAPVLLAVAVGAWLLVIALTGFVGLATVAAAVVGTGGRIGVGAGVDSIIGIRRRHGRARRLGAPREPRADPRRHRAARGKALVAASAKGAAMSGRSELLRLLADGALHSGEELAAALSISRAAVWKRLQQLESWGIACEARPGSGYRLEAPIDLLDAAADPGKPAAGGARDVAQPRSARIAGIDQRPAARDHRPAARPFRRLPRGIPERRSRPPWAALGRAFRLRALPLGQLELSRCAGDARRALARGGRRGAPRARPPRLRAALAQVAERHPVR